MTLTSLVLVVLSPIVPPPAWEQFTQQGPKLVGGGWTGTSAVAEGALVAFSAARRPAPPGLLLVYALFGSNPVGLPPSGR